MLATERSARLEPILWRLRRVPGVEEVWSDDWDSNAVNVFLRLRRTGDHLYDKRKPLGFPVHLRTIKAAIKRAAFGEMNFLDWPVPEYSSVTLMGKTDRFKDGYSGDTIKIEVFV